MSPGDKNQEPSRRIDVLDEWPDGLQVQLIPIQLPSCVDEADRFSKSIFNLPRLRERLQFGTLSRRIVTFPSSTSETLKLRRETSDPVKSE